MKIQYNGSYPNLCSGQLEIEHEGVNYVFPKYCMSSGGSVYFTNGYADEHVESGPWTITDWPKNFPENLKGMAKSEVNDAIDWGCCGGCI